MISPYVRRRRLAAEITRLRDDHGYSADRLARSIGVARQRISRLENGHVRPDLDEIMRILAELGVGQPRWNTIMAIARESQERGWWEKFATQMGPRQALYANLEAGASTISEYQLTLLPGLLQIPTFTQARARVDHSAHGQEFDRERAVEARAARQQVMQRPGGPTYEVIIDELAVRRLAAPGNVVCRQLDHLIDLGHNNSKITIRVLRVGARIADHAVARSPFSVYRYPDPDDPVVVAVDTVTSDLVLTDAAEVDYYLALYDRLREAALAPLDSLDLLAAVAEELREKDR
ncbi:transcriptional regulator [Catellatospora sp. TT07R-123]|uniref:helix-turn-helix domain-containing protein n=1 Tax=Catellatospora sp. TT07R-123 TaxID=2733863 RepID=UPI001B08D0C6|nr:helix-turn-helix transcriptional regulator [Catellatospora sp. TT07R-123]GHJ45907.1 transcriptional regulator [Catellatospora sp. TT07R-123]